IDVLVTDHELSDEFAKQIESHQVRVIRATVK
nr:XRE family transcriptional regulator [Vibrio cholerae]